MDDFIAIIGGGPAGLMAAEVVSAKGHRVRVYDRKPSVGRKFLMAGRGGLNLTHTQNIESFLDEYREQRNFMEPIIRNFSPENLRGWCEDLGEPTFEGSSGRVFPKSMKASPLLRAWLARLDKNGVEFALQRTWKGWDEQSGLVFEKPDGTTQSARPRATLLAMGGGSWPGLGSDGHWVPLLKSSKLPVSPLRPSNCGFVVDWTPLMREKFAGQPLKNISISFEGEVISGEAMIAQNGIEGGAIYALSSSVRNHIEVHGASTITIDLRHGLSEEQVLQKLKNPRGRQSFTTWIHKALNFTPLQTALLFEAERQAHNLPPENLTKLIKALPLVLKTPFAIERAISSAGGLCSDALDSNMMVKAIPGVFAAGEMLDWEAPTGGYLLQGCFATGYAAGHGILNWIS